MSLTALPETGVEVSESKFVLSRLPDVVDCIGQLPLSDLCQLVSPGRRQGPVEGVLSGALCGVRLAVVLTAVLHFDR